MGLTNRRTQLPCSHLDHHLCRERSQERRNDGTSELVNLRAWTTAGTCWNTRNTKNRYFHLPALFEHTTEQKRLKMHAIRLVHRSVPPRDPFGWVVAQSTYVPNEVGDLIRVHRKLYEMENDLQNIVEYDDKVASRLMVALAMFSHRL